MAILTIENLTVTVAAQKRVVDGVSCVVKAGEILAIIGPNGAGKSSVIKAVSGDLAFAGKVIMQGSADTRVERARQLAVLPQLSLLNFPYRVSEVVRLSRIPHCTGRVRDNEIIDHALTLMDISALKNRLYTELSGGEKQRVQLARAFAQLWDQGDAPNGTRLLLLDEPSAALDLGHQRDLMEAIKKFSSHGVAIVMVLHDVNLAAQYADKILALLEGQQIAHGSVKKVITADNIYRLFGIQANVIEHPVAGTPVVIGL